MIKELQIKLNDAGASPQLVVDGVMGPATRFAIREFQRRSGLVIDGIAGPQTMAALNAPRKIATFEEWMQSRLVAHGFPVSIDGAIGPQTTAALRNFQKANGLTQTGIADRPTVDALRAAPSDIAAPSYPLLELMPPWMAEMHRRRGLHEVRDNSILSTWLRIGRYLGDPAKLPWCGDAMETCIVKTLPEEPVPTSPFWAQAWATFGKDAGSPIVGAVGVIRWNASSGHVGIVANWDSKRILLLGGNQSNSINLTWFNRSVFIAYRWPKTYPVRKYPTMNASGVSSGSVSSTR